MSGCVPREPVSTAGRSPRRCLPTLAIRGFVLRRVGNLDAGLSPPHYFVLGNIAAVAGLVEGARPARELAKWETASARSTTRGSAAAASEGELTLSRRVMRTRSPSTSRTGTRSRTSRRSSSSSAWDTYESRVVGTPSACCELLRRARRQGHVLHLDVERRAPSGARRGDRRRRATRSPRTATRTGWSTSRARPSSGTTSAVEEDPRGPDRHAGVGLPCAVVLADLASRSGRSTCCSSAACEYDSSIFPVSDRLYGIPSALRFPFVIREDGDRQLVEFPMSTARAVERNCRSAAAPISACSRTRTCAGASAG